MTLIGILLILVGIFGLYSGTIGYGDIGIVASIAGAAALLSGIGFLIVKSNIKKLTK